jgi:putative PIN family toxin of toxin-antitoxin system
MNVARLQVVLDCNILLQAVSRRTGPSAAIFRHLEQNHIEAFVSKAIIREFRKIWTYPGIVARNPHVTEAVVNDFVDYLLFRGTLVRDVPHVIDFPRDPHDEPYLDLALAVGADYLVTRDPDMLSLADGHSPEAKQFRQRCPKLRIVMPPKFLAILEVMSQ